jgi:hypothetical protein
MQVGSKPIRGTKIFDNEVCSVARCIKQPMSTVRNVSMIIQKGSALAGGWDMAGDHDENKAERPICRTNFIPRWLMETAHLLALEAGLLRVRISSGGPYMGHWYNWEHRTLARFSRRFDSGMLHQECAVRRILPTSNKSLINNTYKIFDGVVEFALVI